jgi:PPK2 family polyphosphate:nucleotide phosphotransferase
MMCCMLETNPYRVAPGAKVSLGDTTTKDDGGLDQKAAEAELEKTLSTLSDLQELMYAEGKHALLAVFQAMDAGGKDSTIRHVFGPVNAAGCYVVSFKQPTEHELARDFLWRVHQHVPPKGSIAVFNRSHYEDVLVVRVKNLVPKETWKQRYEQINAFERLLVDEGTAVVKFFLHVSRDYQKERLQRRLEKPDKWWKFNPADLEERKRWDEYQEAFEDALAKCSTKHAPWYVVPAERRWFRDLLVARVLTETLDSLEMKYPKPTFDPKTIVIK